MKASALKLNNDVSVDLEKLIEGGMVILANSGGGKSYAIRRLVEQAVGKVQVIILDPEGEFASLREKYDFILAGKDADVPAEPRSAHLLATKLLELNKSAVIDLYELHPQERQRFVKNFCDALVNAPKSLYHPVLIILDEAHEYVPEGKPSEATWAVESLASKGRKRGQRLILASQRISKLSKNAAAEANNKLIGRASQDIDMKRAGDELGFTKEKLVQLRQLKPGEFFAFGPAISDEVIKLKIGEVKTSHAKVGYKGVQKTPPPSDVIKRVLAELKDLPQEAKKEAQTVGELKKENSELKRMNTNLLKNPYQKDVDVEEIREAINRAVAKVDREWAGQWAKMLADFKKYFSLLSKIRQMIPETFPDFVVFDPNIAARELSKHVPEISPKVLKTGIVMPVKEFDDREVVGVNRGEKEILNAIAQFEEGITTEHIAVLTGYKATSRREYLRKLMAGSLIERRGEMYIATDAGKRELGDDFKPLPTGGDLRAHWLATLPDGEKKIFITVCEAYPDGITKEDIGLATGYKATSVREYVRKLNARKIVTIEGALIKVADNLY